MQTKRMSLATIQGKLSRAEMKNIMAGSSSVLDCGDECGSNSDCSTNSSCKSCKAGKGPGGKKGCD